MPSKKKQNYDLPREEFLDALKSLGGCPEAVLNSKELMDYFEPILRADFQAIETMVYNESKPFDITMNVWVVSDEDISF